jgi:hypothetical protein
MIRLKKGDVYLHIGLHKTGTTFLQREVFPKMNINFIHKTNKNKIDKNKKNLLSNEDLCGNPFKEDLFDRKIILHGLKALYPNAKIIVGLREKESITKSLYSQWVKNGGVEKYPFFRKKILSSPKFDYDKLINLLNGIFGSKNVYIYKFEELRDNPKKSIDGICKFMKEDTPDFEIKQHNVAWSKKQIFLCRNFNKIFNYHYKDKSGRRGIYSNRNFIGKFR